MKSNVHENSTLTLWLRELPFAACNAVTRLRSGPAAVEISSQDSAAWDRSSNTTPTPNFTLLCHTIHDSILGATMSRTRLHHCVIVNEQHRFKARSKRVSAHAFHLSLTRIGCGPSHRQTHTAPQEGPKKTQASWCQDFNLGCTYELSDKSTASWYYSSLRWCNLHLNSPALHNPAGSELSFLAPGSLTGLEVANDAPTTLFVSIIEDKGLTLVYNGPIVGSRTLYDRLSICFFTILLLSQF